MNILLVNPSSYKGKRAGVYSDSMFPMPPLGLAYLAAVSKALGHDTVVEDQYASDILPEEIADMAVRMRADVLGLSCLSPNMPVVEQIVMETKRRLPRVHITLGNVHATMFAEEILQALPVDSIVMGEGEATFEALLKAIEIGGGLSDVAGLAYRKNGRPAINAPRPPIQDLDTLPLPAWELLRIDDYMSPPRLMFRNNVIAVHASRGCPWSCSFCAQNVFMPGVRKRSLPKVVDEIQWLLEDRGVSCFGFQDAIFPFSKEEGLEFCRLLTERKLDDKVKWFTETRSDLVDQEMLTEFKRCGCLFVMFGFESASREHLARAGKGLDPSAAIEAVRMAKQAKLYTYGLFMIGFPDETEAEALKTISFAKKLDCDVASFARVTPYPGTGLYKEYHDSFPPGLDPMKWNNQYRPAPGEPMWHLPGMSHQQINDLLRKAMLGYYLRPHMIARHIRIGIFSMKDIFKGVSYLGQELLSMRPFSKPGAGRTDP